MAGRRLDGDALKIINSITRDKQWPSIVKSYGKLRSVLSKELVHRELAQHGKLKLVKWALTQATASPNQ